MTDTVCPAKRSQIMSRVRSRDTSPELRVRRGLHRLGLRFSLHRKNLPGKPDLVFRRHRAVVFVNGCFWHRHPGCREATTPKSNVDFWHAKFARNVERDREAKRRLGAKGWRVFVVWECELKRDAQAVVAQLASRIRREPLLYPSDETPPLQAIADGATADSAQPLEEAPPRVAKIVSGGQTGADRGGLDAAIAQGIPHGGWCPEGRKAEDGPIPMRYHLCELPGGDYLDRTRQNVVDSDVTVIFTCGELLGGSLDTARFADIYARPWLHVDLERDGDHAADIVASWLETLGRGGLTVNVAGNRASKTPDIQTRVRDTLLAAMAIAS